MLHYYLAATRLHCFAIGYLVVVCLLRQCSIRGCSRWSISSIWTWSTSLCSIRLSHWYSTSQYRLRLSRTSWTLLDAGLPRDWDLAFGVRRWTFGHGSCTKLMCERKQHWRLASNPGHTSSEQAKSWHARICSIALHWYSCHVLT